MSLTPAERETVILMDDDSYLAIITTHQRSMITKLEKNPSAKRTADLTIEGTRGARFLVPAKLINVRKPMKLSTDQRRQRSDEAASRLRARRAE